MVKKENVDNFLEVAKEEGLLLESIGQTHNVREYLIDVI